MIESQSDVVIKRVSHLDEQPTCSLELNLNLHNSQQTLLNHLSQQKKQSNAFHHHKRVLINSHKTKDVLQLKQNLSMGYPKHNSEFRTSVRGEDYFQPKKPVMLMPMDTVLNNFDNTKRFLKEISSNKNFPRTQSYYKSYNKHPWSYVQVNSNFIEGGYKCMPHEEPPIIKPIKEPIFRPVLGESRKCLFSQLESDKIHVHVPLNGVHQVQYTGIPVIDNPSRTSKLNEKQRVKPFTPFSSRSDYLQKDIERQNYTILDQFREVQSKLDL